MGVDVVFTSAGRTYAYRNERGEQIGDCVCRALAGYLGLPYAEVTDYLLANSNYTPYDGLTDYTYELLRGDCHTTRVMAALGLTFVRQRVRLNSATVREKLPPKAILWFVVPSKRKGHFAYYENGTIYDTFDTRRGEVSRQTWGWFVEAA